MKKILLVSLFLFGSISNYIFALNTHLSADKIIVNQIGEEIRSRADNVNPGDIIEYIYTIENDNKLSAYYLQPAIPIPKETKLIPKSIFPDNFKVSVDGINFIDFPVLDQEKEEVPASAYKIIKWNIDELKSKEVIDVRLRVKIDS